MASQAEAKPSALAGIWGEIDRRVLWHDGPDSLRRRLCSDRLRSILT